MRSTGRAKTFPPSVQRLPLASGLLLALGLALSTATQLRPTSLPVGPGETALLLWGLVAIGGGLLRDDLRLPRYGTPFVAFWALALAVLCFDLIAANLSSRELGIAYRPLAAYLFVLFLLFAFLSRHAGAAATRAAAWFVGTSTVLLAAVFLAAQFASKLGPVEPWYSFRFRGWAENPNQIAFQLTPVPFFAVFLMRRAQGRTRQLAWGLLAAIAVLLGASTFSDALVAAWTVAGSAFFVFDFVFWRDRRSVPLWAGLSRYVVLPLGGLALALLFGTMFYRWLEREAVAIYEQGAQGIERLLLWRHGLQALSVAPILGLGPGAHSGIAGPFLGAEAHNSLIDWASNTGLVGLAAYGALITWLTVRVWRRRDAALIAALIALQTVSCFHYTFRHPVFWFCLAFIGAATFEGPRQDHVRVRG